MPSPVPIRIREADGEDGHDGQNGVISQGGSPQVRLAGVEVSDEQYYCFEGIYKVFFPPWHSCGVAVPDGVVDEADKRIDFIFHNFRRSLLRLNQSHIKIM